MYGRYFVLFAILFTGWFLRKINFIDEKMDHSINKLVVYFASVSYTHLRAHET